MPVEQDKVSQKQDTSNPVEQNKTKITHVKVKTYDRTSYTLYPKGERWLLGSTESVHEVFSPSVFNEKSLGKRLGIGKVKHRKEVDETYEIASSLSYSAPIVYVAIHRYGPDNDRPSEEYGSKNHAERVPVLIKLRVAEIRRRRNQEVE